LSSRNSLSKNVRVAEPLKVIVYVKPSCTLCGPVIETIERVRREVDLSLEKVDISGDQALMSKYGHEIPVVLINGRKAFKGRVPEAQLRKRLLRARETEANEVEGLRVESLEALDEPPFVPPRPVAAFLVLLAIAAFGFFVATGFQEAGHGREKLTGALLKVAPRNDVPVSFNFEEITGRKVSLDSLRGKVVLVNFWATWCPPCIEEMPSMLRLAERMKAEPNFVMLAISADDSWKPVREYFTDKGKPPFEVLLDPSGAVAKQYGTTMFPETYVIVDGKITAFIEGPRDWDQWYADEYLRSLL
jgi:thiol-disulfide isomerase/thioredoxin